MRKKTPQDCQQNCQIGQRLKSLRSCAGVTRIQLAEHLKLSTQQIQKYENGTNRLAVSTLIKIAEFLEVPIWDFIEDENGDIIDSQEQRALYYWRSLNHPKLQRGFTDLMQCMSQVKNTMGDNGTD